VIEGILRGAVPDRSKTIGGHLRLRGSLSFRQHNRHRIGDANHLARGLFAANFREDLFSQRGKNGTEPVETPIVALIRGEIRKPLRKVVLRVSVNLADGRPLFDEAEHVRSCRCCQHLLVGKVRIAVVALPLGRCGESASVALADEQVDPNKRRGSVHVAKGGCVERCLVAPFFKPPAATWFFNS